MATLQFSDVPKYRINPKIRQRIRREWVRSLQNEPAFILACGPSLNKIDPYLDLFNNYFTIGINRSYEKFIPNILTFQDQTVYDDNPNKIKELSEKCLIVYRLGICSVKGIAFQQVSTEWELPTSLFGLHGYKTSVPLAFQIAYTFRCNPIIIFGADCGYKEGQPPDFYGENKYHHENTFINAQNGMRWVKDKCNQLGIELIVCSENGITEYQEISDVMKKISNKSRTKEYYNSKLSI